MSGAMASDIRARMKSLFAAPGWAPCGGRARRARGGPATELSPIMPTLRPYRRPFRGSFASAIAAW